MPTLSEKIIIRPSLKDLKEIYFIFHQCYPDAEFKILQNYDEYTTIKKDNFENQILQCPNFQGIHILKKKNDSIIAEFLIRDKCEDFFSPEQKYNKHIKISLKDNKELLKKTLHILEKNSHKIKEKIFNWAFSFYNQITLYCLFFVTYFLCLIPSSQNWVTNIYIAAIASLSLIDYLKIKLNPVQFIGEIERKHPIRKTLFFTSLTFPILNMGLIIF